MSKPIQQMLNWIDRQHGRMCELVLEWSSINTGTFNLDGLERQTNEIISTFGHLADQTKRIDLPAYQNVDHRGKITQIPLGQALSFTKRPDAALSVLLGIHIDTVYAKDHPFQEPQRVDENTLRGPGVADAKGGLIVMLTALEALDKDGLAPDLGWQVLINPDEEIGSPGSSNLLTKHASKHQVGLVFEPTLPDGNLISARKGSGNFTAVIRGRAAHVGREFEKGRNAVRAAAGLAAELSSMTGTYPGLTVNVGRIDGGGPVNVVPDLAICHFNVRMQRPQDVLAIKQEIDRIIRRIGEADGLKIELHGGLNSPPKPLDSQTQYLLGMIKGCGQKLNLDIGWRESGGVCDGNKLAAAGLPTVDTLGPRGGAIHSDQEYLLLDSLTERAKLAALVMIQLATDGLGACD